MANLVRQLTPSGFPELLREIPDRPERLFTRGTLPPAGSVTLCVVGSRAASAYGIRAVRTLIEGLRGSPVAIVSGLALGIDAEALAAALNANLHATAVLPSSVDDKSIYPASNQPLAARILASGGALVSEYETPYRPYRHSFPARDRIMAGLCKATLIIEAAEKSGTLITARLALDYNREVLTVPHPLDSEHGAGPNRLIREGATLVRHSTDILEALGLQYEPTQVALPTDITRDEMHIINILKEPKTRDQIIEVSGLTAQEAGIALSSLTIRGIIVERVGKIERA